MKSRLSSIRAKSLATGIIAILSIVLSSISVNSNPVNAAPIVCNPAVLMLRGSGESRAVRDSTTIAKYPRTGATKITTNGYEGEVIQRSLDKLAESSNDEIFSNIRFIGIDYPAPQVEIPFKKKETGKIYTIEEAKAFSQINSAIALKHILDYSESIDIGGQKVNDFIDSDMRSGCDTQYLVMGYSQGALAARVAVNLVDNPEKLIGTYLIGDPYQAANSASYGDIASLASTGIDKDGSVRVGVKSAITTSIAWPFLFPVGIVGAAVNEKFGSADSTIYRDDNKFNSRVLCHKSDLVCAFDIVDGLSVPDHENYYFGVKEGEIENPSSPSPGTVDRILEAPAFEAHLEKLAQTRLNIERDRSLQSGISIQGKPTTYSVSNTRPGDICSWDAGSDESIEYTGPCTTYRYNHGSATQAKMTVHVKDSYNFTRTFATDEQRVDPKSVASLSGVPYDEWIRYESLANPTQCMTIDQDFTDHTSTGELRTNECLTSPSKNTAFNGTQVFKRVSATVNGKSVDRYLWGYDDKRMVVNYFGHIHEGYPWVRGELNYVSWDEHKDVQKAETKLAKIIDGVPYYQFVVLGPESGCIETGLPITAAGETPYMRECDSSNDNQLFKAVPAGEGYGNLTLENDKVKPSSITGFKKNSLAAGNLSVSWNSTTDNRTDKLRSFHFEFYDSYDKAWRDTDYLNIGVNVSDSQTQANFTDVPSYVSKVRIRGADYAANYNSWVSMNIR